MTTRYIIIKGDLGLVSGKTQGRGHTGSHCEQTDRRERKNYLPATSLADGKNYKYK